MGHDVGKQKVSELLHDLEYSLQSLRKTTEGSSHPDRNAQFEHINRQAKAFQAKGEPVISVDTKKKRLFRRICGRVKRGRGTALVTPRASRDRVERPARAHRAERRLR
jgi:hypothetical protein